MENKVLVSTDIGSDIDDALSILSMINAGMDLRGIYTTNSKDLIVRSLIAKHMVNLSKKEIIVANGEAMPILSWLEPYEYFEDANVDDKYIDEERSRGEPKIHYISLKKAGIIKEGVKDLAERLSQDKYTIFSLAPLTNIARLILNHPDSIKNIDNLYIMGGSIEGRIEHNIRYDCDAAEIVFNSNIPITLIPGDLCERYRMPVSRLESFDDNELSGYVHKMTRGFVAAKTGENIIKKSLRDKLRRDVLLNYHPKVNNENKERIVDKINLKYKDRLVESLYDIHYSILDPEDYFSDFNELITDLRDKEINYEKGEETARTLEECIPTEISVADVYVPYCFLNRDKLRIVRGNLIGGSEMGATKVVEGNRFEIVVDLDFKDFSSYLERYVR